MKPPNTLNRTTFHVLMCGRNHHDQKNKTTITIKITLTHNYKNQTMKEITEFLASSKMPTEECIKLLNLISEYGKSRWIEGFDKAAEVAGYGEPHAPQIRTEPRTNLQNVGI